MRANICQFLVLYFFLLRKQAIIWPVTVQKWDGPPWSRTRSKAKCFVWGSGCPLTSDPTPPLSPPLPFFFSLLSLLPGSPGVSYQKQNYSSVPWNGDVQNKIPPCLSSGGSTLPQERLSVTKTPWQEGLVSVLELPSCVLGRFVCLSAKPWFLLFMDYMDQNMRQVLGFKWQFCDWEPKFPAPEPVKLQPGPDRSSLCLEGAFCLPPRTPGGIQTSV